ncbi:hypothetical protein HID58_080446 [Brassica napus]|uniref:BnaCnng04980D protein n=3 Tax=Brassica TaxID=3705 RepID=A0A078GTE4_BRANA|nr:hypothetical protein HID58_080446 [Brassica napus]CDY27913.1 BnaCnng04980D [Brassica napus]
MGQTKYFNKALAHQISHLINLLLLRVYLINEQCQLFSKCKIRFCSRNSDSRKEMDLSPRTNRIYDFLSKAYEMVDDPSTDKIISWGPNGTSFIGFSKISVSGGQQLEFVCDDFVKGHPELLEKIGDRYMAKLRAFHEKRYKPFEDRLKNAKTKEEWDLAVKEQKEFFKNDCKERRESRLRMESSPLAPENQVQSNGT